VGVGKLATLFVEKEGKGSGGREGSENKARKSLEKQATCSALAGTSNSWPRIRSSGEGQKTKGPKLRGISRDSGQKKERREASSRCTLYKPGIKGPHTGEKKGKKRSGGGKLRQF